MKTRKLYDIQFRRYQRPPPGRAGRWQRWATSAQEARASAIKALYWEYPEGFRIVSVEETGQTYTRKGQAVSKSRFFVVGTLLVDGKERVYQNEVSSGAEAHMQCGAAETVLIRHQCEYCGEWVALPNPCPCGGWREKYK